MEKTIKKENKINIAITGCIHGCLKKLYTDLLEYQTKNNINIDLVLCTGDFECMITEDDLNYLSCPLKYRHMGDFHKYYSGLLPTPFLTIFIGGNHEASNILNELFYGGYITEKVYYLGRSGIINYKGITIAGISGIFNEWDYLKGHYEKKLDSSVKSIYHQREFELAKISNYSKKIDIFMTHDWPNDIINKNDINKISKITHWKDFDKIGSNPNKFLLDFLKPNYWICGHMHFYYKNIIKFNDKEETKIYCLDKCLKNRKYFDVITLDAKNNDDDIYIDNEWLSITQIFNEIMPKESIYYNLSDYINNCELYLKYIIDLFPNYFDEENKFTIKKKEFFEKLKEFKEKNKENQKVEKNLNQKETILKIFNLYNNFSLNKKDNKNIEEINLEF